MRVWLSPSQPYPTLARTRTLTLAVALAPTLSLTLTLPLTVGELDGRREEWHDEQAEQQSESAVLAVPQLAPFGRLAPSISDI